jgi:hypothetical protein
MPIFKPGGLFSMSKTGLLTLFLFQLFLIPVHSQTANDVIMFINYPHPKGMTDKAVVINFYDNGLIKRVRQYRLDTSEYFLNPFVIDSERYQNLEFDRANLELEITVEHREGRIFFVVDSLIDDKDLSRDYSLLDRTRITLPRTWLNKRLNERVSAPESIYIDDILGSYSIYAWSWKQSYSYVVENIPIKDKPGWVVRKGNITKFYGPDGPDGHKGYDGICVITLRDLTSAPYLYYFNRTILDSVETYDIGARVLPKVKLEGVREPAFFLKKGIKGTFTATSFLTEEKTAFPVGNLGAFDGKPWAEGVEGRGIGERIGVQFPKPVQCLVIGNGFYREDKLTLYTDNGRIWKIRITDTATGFSQEAELLDAPAPQMVFLKKPMTEMKIEILDVYIGEKWDDTCLNSLEGIPADLFTERELRYFLGEE